MKDFLKFLWITPKASISALIVALMQLIKFCGLINIDTQTLNTIADSISIIAGFIGLYFAGKGSWPETPPK